MQFRHSQTPGRRGASEKTVTLSQRRPALRPVGNETLHTRVYNQLHHALICGSFQPGQPVTLRQLMVALGTSAMPVRGAIARLIAEGALDMLPNRSVIVPRMSRAKLVELWRVRQMMEGMAAERACQHAADVVLPEIKTINTALKKAILDRDIASMLSKNYEFHFAIYGRSDLTVLPPILHTLWLQAGPFLSLTFAACDRLWTTIRHTAAIRAFEAGDAAAVRAAIEQDIGDTLKPLLKHGLFSE